MAEESHLRTHVEADVSGFVEGMHHAEQALERVFSAVASGNLSGLGQSLLSIGEFAAPLLGVAAAAIALHEAFKVLSESVEATEKWNLENYKLSKQLGTTVEDASVLNETLKDLNIPTEAYTRAANFMTRSLQSNQLGFKNLGIETKNADGSFRDTQDIMGEAIEKLGELQDGTSKNVIGQQIFGRAWIENQNILLVTAERLRETDKQMSELGTKSTPTTVANSRAFSLAMKDVHNVFEAFFINIGNKVMPTLTEIALWFAHVGTSAVQIFRQTLDELSAAWGKYTALVGPVVAQIWDLLVTAFHAVVEVVAQVRESVLGFIDGLVHAITPIGDLVDWLGKRLPSAGTAAMAVFKAVETVLIVLTGAVGGAIKFVQMFATLVLGALGTIGKAIVNFMHGDFAKMAEDWDAGWKKTMASTEERGAELADAVKRTADRVREVWADKSTDESAGLNMGRIVAPEKKKTITDLETKDKSKELVGQWKEALDEIKLKEENWFSWSHQKELEFWQDKLKQTKEGTEARKEVLHLVEQSRKAVTEETRKAEGENITSQIDQEKKAATEAVSTLEGELKQKEQLLDAEAERNKLRREAAVNVAKITKPTDELDISAKAVQDELAEAQKLADEKQRIRNEDLQREIETIRTSLALEKEKFAELRALNANNQAEIAAINKREVANDAEAASQIRKIEQQQLLANQRDLEAAEKRRIQSENTTTELIAKKQAEFAKKAEGYLQPFVQGFSNGIKKILDGTLSFSDAIKGMGQMMVSAFADMAGQMATDFLKSLAKMAADWLAHLLFQQTAQEASDAIRLATGAPARVAEATGNVGVAATAAAASVASIPLVGWAMIPGVVAATLGELGPFVAMAGAAGGFDIPAGLNPVTQLHQQEMVLPASIANPLRSMIAAGSQPGGGGGGTVASVTIHAMDGASVERVLRTNSKQFTKVVRELSRDRKLRK